MGGGAGTVLILEPVGGFEGVPHTVRIKLNSYGFSFIFHEDSVYHGVLAQQRLLPA